MVVNAGDFIYASDVNDAASSMKYKNGNQGLTTSSTTLQNVTSMVWSVVTISVYFIDLVIFYNAASVTPDMKIGWTAPSGAAMDWGAAPYVDTAGAVTVISGLTIGSTLANGADTPKFACAIRGVLTTGTTAGNLQLQAAQNTSSADAVTILAGTHGSLTLAT